MTTYQPIDSDQKTPSSSLSPPIEILLSSGKLNSFKSKGEQLAQAIEKRLLDHNYSQEIVEIESTKFGSTWLIEVEHEDFAEFLKLEGVINTDNLSSYCVQNYTIRAIKEEGIIASLKSYFPNFIISLATPKWNFNLLLDWFKRSKEKVLIAIHIDYNKYCKLNDKRNAFIPKTKLNFKPAEKNLVERAIKSLETILRKETKQILLQYRNHIEKTNMHECKIPIDKLRDNLYFEYISYYIHDNFRYSVESTLYWYPDWYKCRRSLSIILKQFFFIRDKLQQQVGPKILVTFYIHKYLPEGFFHFVPKDNLQSIHDSVTDN